MLSKLTSGIKAASSPSKLASAIRGASSLSTSKGTQPSGARHVTYTSNDIAIPDTFLLTPPSKPITSTPIDFASSPLPQYAGHVALVLENVLSKEECGQMLALAEASVPRGADDAGASPWRPAMVNLGGGLESPAPGYRESDRIIWNQQTVVDRLWDRCTQVEGLSEMLATVADEKGGRWDFRRCNERMRFLKYSPGQYFKRHCDGPFWYEEGDKEFMTFYTVHLYLNDSVENDPQSELVGGATAFLSRRTDDKINVNPKAGSVLIFQHKGLLHEGAIVEKGTKYTMRTDILYESIPDDKTKKVENKQEKKEEAKDA